jgi:2,4-dienoyl-CoA reductase-like NADH-dependent reductase (Old Yellow Enzyme family)
MSGLFEATEINGMTLRNRFIRSATWEGLANENGSCSSRLVDGMARLAQGGVGLIVTGHAYVREDGQAGPRQLGVYDDALIDGLRGVVDAVHNKGCCIVIQLAHAGLSANTKLTGHIPVAPSLVDGFVKTPRKELTKKDIREIVEAFGKAAERGKEAGFDGVQLRPAHGYLLNQFISPAFNVREDDYGGSLENRARVLLEILQRIRSSLGPDYPIMVKLNNQDYLENGLTLEDSLQIGRILEKNGVDAIELSGGTFASGKLGPIRGPIHKEGEEAYFKESGKVFKEKLGIPICLVGGIRSLPVAESLLKNGFADYISMSRPFIREPDLIKRWASGDLRKAACISDSKCFGPAISGEGIYCVVEKRQQGNKFSH